MKTKTHEKAVIKLAVLESDPLRFIGLRALLESAKDLDLVSVPLGETDQLLKQDVVLLPERGGANAFDVIDELRARRPDVRIVLLGSAVDDERVVRAVTGGARGYLHENASAEEFAQAVRIVAQGMIWAPRRIFASVIDRTMTATQKLHRGGLTNREKQVLQMLVAGKSNKEIGAPLGIEERTVKAHVAKLMRKFGVENRIKLSVHAITHSLVTPN